MPTLTIKNRCGKFATSLLIVYVQFCVFLGAPCADADTKILEYKDILHFELSEKKSSSESVLLISGLIFHSSMGVAKADYKESSGKLAILVQLVSIRPGLSGNLSLNVAVPPTVDVVVFGKEAKVIWRRPEN